MGIRKRSGWDPEAICVASLGMYASMAENDVSTVTPGFCSSNRSRASSVRTARSSLPHHWNEIVTGPSSVGSPSGSSPAAHAVTANTTPTVALPAPHALNVRLGAVTAMSSSSSSGWMSPCAVGSGARTGWLRNRFLGTVAEVNRLAKSPPEETMTIHYTNPIRAHDVPDPDAIRLPEGGYGLVASSFD